MCQACFYGKLTGQPWRVKPKNQEGTVKTITIAGQCVSVDQLESPVQGFVGQMKGILTKKRYKVATIFVDHQSNYSFVHLQSTTNAVETLQAKQEFERHAQRYNVLIKQYHADNGKQDIQDKSQILTFSGVGAHH
jgi:hypothetical protein